ncbi:hypothetical protein HZS_3705 [Henneguya salminicola]|nr:hypothetical protein HZS_3705 [Henneguya salminicola]
MYHVHAQRMRRIRLILSFINSYIPLFTFNEFKKILHLLFHLSSRNHVFLKKRNVGIYFIKYNTYEIVEKAIA